VTEVPVETVGLDALSDIVAGADLVLSATGSDGHVLDAALLDDAGETFVVDLAQPRDVAPAAGGVDAVTVRDLDALEDVTDETRAARADAAERVEAMVAEELDHLLGQYKRKRADQVIAAMYEGAERVKSREVGKALSAMEADGLTTDQEAAVEAMADALVNQLLSAPTQSLREAAEQGDWTTINSALELFGPGMRVRTDADGVPPGAVDADDIDAEQLPPEMRDRMADAVLDQFAGESD
jgi:glutamyl-tRNA reductase